MKVRDLSLAEPFYGGALGLAVVRRAEDESGIARSIWLSLGEDAFLALERAEAGEPIRSDASPGWHCVALGIRAADREAWRARLSENGVPVFRETAYTLYVRDPDGAIVALSHYPHPAADIASSDPPSSIETSPLEPAPTASATIPDAAPARAPGGITAWLATLVTLSLAWLVLVAGDMPASAQRRVRIPPDVVVLGSSSINGALGRMIEERLIGAGLRVRRVGRSSSGFARPDFFDWSAQIPSLGDLRAMRGVVIYMGGNDTQAIRLTRAEQPDRGGASWIPFRDEARWREVYVARVRRFVEALCAGGARRAVLLLPADGDREGWSDRIQRVQDAQVLGVRGTRCGVVVDPRGREVGRGDTTDGVHLSRRGARDLLLRIGPPIVAAIAG